MHLHGTFPCHRWKKGSKIILSKEPRFLLKPKLVATLHKRWVIIPNCTSDFHCNFSRGGLSTRYSRHVGATELGWGLSSLPSSVQQATACSGFTAALAGSSTSNSFPVRLELCKGALKYICVEALETGIEHWTPMIHLTPARKIIRSKLLILRSSVVCKPFYIVNNTMVEDQG